MGVRPVSSTNLRAKVELARVLLTQVPPDPKVRNILTEVLASNPKHEGARRALASLPPVTADGAAGVGEAGR